MGNVDLSKSWGLVWDPIKNAVGGGFVTLLSIIAVIVLVGSLIIFLVKKLRGRGGAISDFTWPILLGAVFSAPEILIPMLLDLLSFIVNLGIALWGMTPWS